MIAVPVESPSGSWFADDWYEYPDFVSPVTVNVMLDAVWLSDFTGSVQRPVVPVVQVAVFPSDHAPDTTTPATGLFDPSSTARVTVAVQFFPLLAVIPSMSPMCIVDADAAVTVTITSSLAVAPPLSVTVSVMVWVPTASVAVGVAPVATCAAPSFHTYDVIVPSESVDVDPFSDTACDPFPSASDTVWSGPARATGAAFAFTVTKTVSLPVAPLSSATVRTMVCTPTASVTLGVTPVAI